MLGKAAANADENQGGLVSDVRGNADEGLVLVPLALLGRLGEYQDRLTVVGEASGFEAPVAGPGARGLYLVVGDGVAEDWDLDRVGALENAVGEGRVKLDLYENVIVRVVVAEVLVGE